MKRQIKNLVAALTLTLCMAAGITQVHASEVVSLNALQNGGTQATEETQTTSVPIVVQASVPEGFDGNLTVQYVGKNTEGFTLTLTSESNYQATIKLPRDVYVYKQSSLADGYIVKVPDSFTTKPASEGISYYLPLSVTAGQVQSAETTVLLFKANFDKLPGKEMVDITSLTEDGEQQAETVQQDTTRITYSGDITLTYSGTEGNSISVTLNKENNYTAEITVKKDIYTLSKSSIDEGFECTPLYSFSVLNAFPDTTNEMIVDVLVAGTNVSTDNAAEEVVYQQPVIVQPEEPVKQTKAILFSLDVPEALKETFASAIYVAYRNNEGVECSVELSPENNFQKMTSMEYGAYTRSYAICYDTQEYMYDSQETFIVSENTPDGTMLNLKMVKDGQVLTNENTTVKKSANNSDSVTLWLVVLLVGAGAGVGIYFWNKNRPAESKAKKAGTKKDNDEEDEDEE